MGQSAKQPVIGDVLRGKYRVQRVLGAGGMGTVVLATHLRLEQQVAIKMLGADVRQTPQVILRFLREARAAARIQSDFVVRILDVDELENGLPYLVMEYLDGRDLETVLRQDGPVPIARAVDWVLQACEGVAEAHTLGIIHRDLKPANFFLARLPSGATRVKLLDFGISKALDPSSSDAEVDLTKSTTIVGSPRYMAPEQLKGARVVDQRADLWSLGVTLYQLVSAKFPFSATTATSLAAQIAADPPMPLREACIDAPVELQAIVHRCLEKDAARRYSNVGELARALAPFSPADATGSAARVSEVLRRAPSIDEVRHGSEGGSPTTPLASTPVDLAVRVTEDLAAPSPAREAVAVTGVPSEVTAPEVAPSPWRRNVGVAVALGLATVLSAAWAGAWWIASHREPPRDPAVTVANATSRGTASQDSAPAAIAPTPSTSMTQSASTTVASASVVPSKKFPVAPVASKNPLDIQLK